MPVSSLTMILSQQKWMHDSAWIDGDWLVALMATKLRLSLAGAGLEETHVPGNMSNAAEAQRTSMLCATDGNVVQMAAFNPGGLVRSARSHARHRASALTAL